MAWKATSSNPQRFTHYLNGLQEEFGQKSTRDSSPYRFNIYLRNLQGEFELMALEIESLQKERRELEAKGTYFVSPLSMEFLYDVLIITSPGASAAAPRSGSQHHL